ncbi:MAG: hypothetical protein JO129_03880 [Candidatus Dependentiae bacterium]|nr:hypothetical protein [Candidatus Dependentiae bacterium]
MKIKFCLCILLCNVWLLPSSDREITSELHNDIDHNKIESLTLEEYKDNQYWYTHYRNSFLNSIQQLKNLKDNEQVTNDEKKTKILNLSLEETAARIRNILHCNKSYFCFYFCKPVITNTDIEQSINLLITEYCFKLRDNNRRYPLFAQLEAQDTHTAIRKLGLTEAQIAFACMQTTQE